MIKIKFARLNFIFKRDVASIEFCTNKDMQFFFSKTANSCKVPLLLCKVHRISTRQCVHLLLTFVFLSQCYTENRHWNLFHVMFFKKIYIYKKCPLRVGSSNSANLRYFSIIIIIIFFILSSWQMLKDVFPRIFFSFLRFFFSCFSEQRS